MNSHFTSYMAKRAEERVNELSTTAAAGKGLHRPRRSRASTFLKRLMGWRSTSV